MTGGEKVRWHHWLNRHEFEQTPGDGEGQGSLHAAVHGVAKSRTRLSFFPFLSTPFTPIHPMKKKKGDPVH